MSKLKNKTNVESEEHVSYTLTVDKIFSEKNK